MPTHCHHSPFHRKPWALCRVPQNGWPPRQKASLKRSTLADTAQTRHPNPVMEHHRVVPLQGRLTFSQSCMGRTQRSRGSGCMSSRSLSRSSPCQGLASDPAAGAQAWYGDDVYGVWCRHSPYLSVTPYTQPSFNMYPQQMSDSAFSEGASTREGAGGRTGSTPMLAPASAGSWGDLRSSQESALHQGLGTPPSGSRGDLTAAAPSSPADGSDAPGGKMAWANASPDHQQGGRVYKGSSFPLRGGVVVETVILHGCNAVQMPTTGVCTRLCITTHTLSGTPSCTQMTAHARVQKQAPHLPKHMHSPWLPPRQLHVVALHWSDRALM